MNDIVKIAMILIAISFSYSVTAAERIVIPYTVEQNPTCTITAEPSRAKPGDEIVLRLQASENTNTVWLAAAHGALEETVELSADTLSYPIIVKDDEVFTMTAIGVHGEGSCQAAVFVDDGALQPAKATALAADTVVAPVAETKGVIRNHDPLAPKVWRNRGADPCKSEAGCTKEWMLSQLHTYDSWPRQVVKALIKAVESGGNSMTMVCDGQRLAMSWGKHVPKFSIHTTVRWGGGECEPAMYWHADHEAVRYHFVKVQVCGNWGGWKTAAPEELEVQPVVESHRRLGILPVTECLDDHNDPVWVGR